MHQDIARVLISREELSETVAALGRQITNDYRGKNLLMVGILRGAVIFFSDLVRHIDLPLEMDFMAVGSYGAATHSSGVVRLIKDLDKSVAGKHLLIVEDIIDTGLTLRYLSENLLTRGPLSLKTCCLLDKPSRRKIEMEPDYVGIRIPDEFVVGYGLDYQEKYRNLPDIGILKPSAYGA